MKYMMRKRGGIAVRPCMSCAGRPLPGCRVGDVQRAVVHVLVVAVRLSCVVLSVELVKRAALKVGEWPIAEASHAVALGRWEHPRRRQGLISSIVMRLHLRKCSRNQGRVTRRSGSAAGACAFWTGMPPPPPLVNLLCSSEMQSLNCAIIDDLSDR